MVILWDFYGCAVLRCREDDDVYIVVGVLRDINFILRKDSGNVRVDFCVYSRCYYSENQLK